MIAGGVTASAVLDELESHLREDVERQTRAGTSEQQAFDAAVKKLGPASALKTEFRKSGLSAALEKMMIAVAAVFVAFIIFLTTAAMILCYSRLGDRLMGFSHFGIPAGGNFWMAPGRAVFAGHSLEAKTMGDGNPVPPAGVWDQHVLCSSDCSPVRGSRRNAPGDGLLGRFSDSDRIRNCLRY